MEMERIRGLLFANRPSQAITFFVDDPSRAVMIRGPVAPAGLTNGEDRSRQVFRA
jgi:hypothetical protein